MTTFTDEVRDTVSPHKFGGSRRAAAAWLISLDGCCDETTGDVDWYAWYGRIGRTILQCDSLGFVDAFKYATEAEARQTFQKIDQDFAAYEGDDV